MITNFISKEITAKVQPLAIDKPKEFQPTNNSNDQQIQKKLINELEKMIILVPLNEDFKYKELRDVYYNSIVGQKEIKTNELLKYLKETNIDELKYNLSEHNKSLIDLAKKDKSYFTYINNKNHILIDNIDKVIRIKNTLIDQLNNSDFKASIETLKELVDFQQSAVNHSVYTNVSLDLQKKIKDNTLLNINPVTNYVSLIELKVTLEEKLGRNLNMVLYK